MNKVTNQIWQQVRNQIRGQVLDQVLEQVGLQVKYQISDQIRGQILKMLVSNGKMDFTEINNKIENAELDRIKSILFQLEKEGFVEIKGNQAKVVD